MAGAAIDPEKLLWEPGRKVISIPSICSPTLDEINVVTQRYLRESPRLIDNIFKQDPLMYFLDKKRIYVSGGNRILEPISYGVNS